MVSFPIYSKIRFRFIREDEDFVWINKDGHLWNLRKIDHDTAWHYICGERQEEHFDRECTVEIEM